MHLESIRKYCLGKEGTITEEFPFDEETLVFKIAGKIFLVADIEGHPLNMNKMRTCGCDCTPRTIQFCEAGVSYE